MLVRDAIAPGGEQFKILDFGIAKLTDKDSPNVKTASSDHGNADVHVA